MSDVANPAGYSATVTPNDSTVFADPARGLYIGGAGTLRVRMYPSGIVQDFPAVIAGPMPVRVDMVHTTGTTATGIVRLW